MGQKSQRPKKDLFLPSPKRTTWDVRGYQETVLSLSSLLDWWTKKKVFVPKRDRGKGGRKEEAYCPGNTQSKSDTGHVGLLGDEGKKFFFVRVSRASFFGGKKLAGKFVCFARTRRKRISLARNFSLFLPCGTLIPTQEENDIFRATFVYGVSFRAFDGNLCENELKGYFQFVNFAQIYTRLCIVDHLYRIFLGRLNNSMF